MPKLLKIVFTFKFPPLHAKISTPTGKPVPDEKVKELSSSNFFAYKQTACLKTAKHDEEDCKINLVSKKKPGLGATFHPRWACYVTATFTEC